MRAAIGSFVSRNAQTLAIATLALANILLLAQNVGLRSRLAEYAPPEFLESGDEVPPLRGMDSIGGNVTIEYPAAPATILLFFSPSCRFCEALFPTWQNVIPVALERGYRVVGVVRAEESPDGVDEYLERWGVSGMEVVYLSSEALLAYRFHATPITLAVGPNGVVQNLWVGTWDEDERAEAARFFGVDLGG